MLYIYMFFAKLPVRIPVGRALAGNGERVTARTALRIGLVTEVVDDRARPYRAAMEQRLIYTGWATRSAWPRSPAASARPGSQARGNIQMYRPSPVRRLS
jgi:enoyl-CoA hydratase/carnithine racemase